MRKAFNMNLGSLDQFTMLVHGGYGNGKTFLGGDMLAHEASKGPVRFVNVTGEDGWSTLAHFGLGDVGETVDTYDDLKAVVAELRAKPARAWVLDSLKRAERLIELKLLGSGRAPRNTKELNESSLINREIELFLASLRRTADIVMVLSPSDRSVDQLTEKLRITPDLPGRNATGVAGDFDFVFCLNAEVQGREVQRVMWTGPSSQYLTRCRLPKPLPTEIRMPAGRGGWKVLYDAIQSTFKEDAAK